MINYFSELTQLSPQEFLICVFVIFIAGMVRGFSGFALSAIVVAVLTRFLPTVELIPMAYLLEAAASLAMFRGGMRDADMSVVWVLAIGSAIGVPIGLYATMSLPSEAAKIIALCLILVLAGLQFFKIAPRFVGTRAGLYGAGLCAGMATGLAHVGGLVVALYILASRADPRSMRGALVMYLFIGMITSLVWHLAYGIMDMRAVMRGVVFIPVLLVGVFIGVQMFRPSLQGFYKRFCLGLLMVLSAAGLVSAF